MEMNEQLSELSERQEVGVTSAAMNEIRWRHRITKRCGGATFDAPGGGYSFSAVLAEERELMKQNMADEPETALLKLSVADPTWKMAPEAMDAAQGFYTVDQNATRYTDNRGIGACPHIGQQGDTHAELANYLRGRFTGGGVKFTPDHVQYSPHSIKGALAEYIPKAFFGESTRLVFPSPGYGVIKDPINNCGAEVEDVPLTFKDRKWDIDYTGIRPTQGKELVLYLNRPHNPTGSGYTADDWKQVLGWAEANNATLIVDEAYIDLYYMPEIVSVLTIPGWEKSCIVLQSVSKGWNATGLRFGWMVAHPTVIKALRKVTDVTDSGMFGPSIAAGLNCLRNPDRALETRDEYKTLHQHLSLGLRSAGFSTMMPDAGLCQFTPAPRAANGVEFKDAVSCAQWFRENLRISLMHYTVNNLPWLRWAVTIAPVPECGLQNEASVIGEAVRRLNSVTFAF